MKSETIPSRNAAGKKAMHKPMKAAGGPKKAERKQAHGKKTGINTPVTEHKGEMDLPVTRKTPSQHQKL